MDDTDEYEETYERIPFDWPRLFVYLFWLAMLVLLGFFIWGIILLWRFLDSINSRMGNGHDAPIVFGCALFLILYFIREFRNWWHRGE